MNQYRLTLSSAFLFSPALAFAFASCGGQASSSPPNPVLLVHGWAGAANDMAVMQGRFEEAGREAFTIELPGQDNVANARAIATEVAEIKSQTGAAKVDLVGNSMGGLSTRYYIKLLNGAPNVGVYVSFGTPHYGGDIACVLDETAGGQMCPGSSFLDDLNADDDTPGDIPYTTIWSDEEEIESAARLDGGACFLNIPGILHVDEPDSPAVFDAALQALAGTCPGTVESQPIE